MRVGIGYDARYFDPGRALVLGGVHVEGAWGLKARGDGDVLLRALADALLGAAGLGDLGDHFPSDEAAWEDLPSAVLLQQVRTKTLALGLEPGNVDATLVAYRPDLAPFRAAMRQRIADLLQVDPAVVNVKAVRGVGPAAVQSGEGIAAHVVVTLGASTEDAA